LVKPIQLAVRYKTLARQRAKTKHGANPSFKKGVPSSCWSRQPTVFAAAIKDHSIRLSTPA